jgi:hypothetical protein
MFERYHKIFFSFFASLLLDTPFCFALLVFFPNIELVPSLPGFFDTLSFAPVYKPYDFVKCIALFTSYSSNSLGHRYALVSRRQRFTRWKLSR